MQLDKFAQALTHCIAAGRRQVLGAVAIEQIPRQLAELVEGIAQLVHGGIGSCTANRQQFAARARDALAEHRKLAGRSNLGVRRVLLHLEGRDSLGHFQHLIGTRAHFAKRRSHTGEHLLLPQDCVRAFTVAGHQLRNAFKVACKAVAQGKNRFAAHALPAFAQAGHGAGKPSCALTQFLERSFAACP